MAAGKSRPLAKVVADLLSLDPGEFDSTDASAPFEKLEPLVNVVVAACPPTEANPHALSGTRSEVCSSRFRRFPAVFDMSVFQPFSTFSIPWLSDDFIAFRAFSPTIVQRGPPFQRGDRGARPSRKYLLAQSYLDSSAFLGPPLHLRSLPQLSRQCSCAHAIEFSGPTGDLPINSAEDPLFHRFLKVLSEPLSSTLAIRCG
jgi:hypothetical protein